MWCTSGGRPATSRTSTTSNRNVSPQRPFRSAQMPATRAMVRRFFHPTASRGAPYRDRTPGLHLDERHHVVPPDDQIEVVAAQPEAVGLDDPPARHQVGEGDELTPKAADVTRVGPVHWAGCGWRGRSWKTECRGRRRPAAPFPRAECGESVRILLHEGASHLGGVLLYQAPQRDRDAAPRARCPPGQGRSSRTPARGTRPRCEISKPFCISRRLDDVAQEAVRPG